MLDLIQKNVIVWKYISARYFLIYEEYCVLYTMKYQPVHYAYVSVHKKCQLSYMTINFSFRECLRFCFFELTQNDLDEIQALYNHHIRAYSFIFTTFWKHTVCFWHT